MSDSVEHIPGTQDELGESPLWNPAEQALYRVDWSRQVFYRYTPADGTQQMFEPGMAVGSLALRAAGGLVMGTKYGFAFWDFASATTHIIADPEADKPSHFNDGAVDCKGRYWVGTNSANGQPAANLYRLDPDLRWHTMQTGITISNGIGWSPDRHTMYYTDSPRRVIYAYDFDVESGAISRRRAFVSTPESPDEPDGLAVDSEGFIWSARWGGWRVVRYDPDGRIDREIALPVEFVTSCAFGGPALDTLYITSARLPLNTAQRAQRPLDGGLFRVTVGVVGQAPHAFLG